MSRSEVNTQGNPENLEKRLGKSSEFPRSISPPFLKPRHNCNNKLLISQMVFQVSTLFVSFMLRLRAGHQVVPSFRKLCGRFSIGPLGCSVPPSLPFVDILCMAGNLSLSVESCGICSQETCYSCYTFNCFLAEGNCFPVVNFPLPYVVFCDSAPLIEDIFLSLNSY